MTPRRLRLPAPGRLVAVAALGTAVVLSRVAVPSPRIAIAVVLTIILVAIALWRLVVGVAVFTVLTFPEHLPGSLGAGLTLAKPIGLVLAISWVLSLAVERTSVPLIFRDHAVLAATTVAFLGWSGASLVWAVDAGTAASHASRLVQVIVLMLLTYSAVRTQKDLAIVMWAFVIGAGMTATYSLATGSYGAGGRLAGIFDPNFFAAELVAAMLLAGFMLPVFRQTPARVALLVLLGVSAVAFVRTESRGGVIALAAALVVAIALAGPVRPQAVAAVLVVFAVGVAYYAGFASTTLRNRISNISAQGSAGRVDEWRIALQIASDRPILGVGLGNYQVVEPDYAARNINLLRVKYVLQLRLETHSTYLNLLSEVGSVGLALFVALLAGTFGVALRGVSELRRLGDTKGEVLARGLLTATAGTLVAYIFLSGQYEKQLWLLLGMLAAIPTLVSRPTAMPATIPEVRS